MHLDDRLRIETPEGVAIEVTLAGLGSRLGAALVDVVIQGVLLIALVLALSLAGAVVDPDLGVFLTGIGTLVVALVVIGYFLVFEALNGGRTPGKAAFGIHVATVDGSPLTLAAVTLRTLMRLVDFLPVGYATGAVAILSTSRNQRLGDLVANTVVIRSRLPARSPGPPAGDDVGSSRRLGWDAATVSPDEVALVRRFVDRRPDLSPGARERLASDLASRLRPKIDGGRDLGDEDFLLQLLIEKGAR